MIKYLILSLVAYYIIVNYLSPKIQQSKDSNIDPKQNNVSKNNQEDDYVDYEEVD
jgi:hypothetical protein